MTDDDLRAAVADRPDDDTPRLAYADYVEDCGDPARAQFIRDQIHFAITPAWEPFAVNVRHFRKHDIWPGTDFAPPPIPGAGPYVTWHPTEPTRRGFGYGLKVESLYTLLKVAPALFEREPVQHLDLPSGTLDEWRELAAAPWFRKVRSIRFTGLTTPIDPLRELAESPNAEGLRSVAFDRCDSPAMPEVLRRMLRSSLGRRLTALDLRLGEYPEEMVAALEGDAAELPTLERLRWERMGCGAELVDHLLSTPAMREVAAVDFTGNQLGIAGPGSGIGRGYSPTELVLHDCRLDDNELSTLLSALFSRNNISLIDVSVNPLDFEEDYLSHLEWPELRSIRAGRTSSEVQLANWLTQLPCWPSLTEINLEGCGLLAEAAAPLLLNTRPASLAGIILNGNKGLEPFRAELMKHYGETVFWTES